MTFRRAPVTDLRREGFTFDVVISNHIMHELPGSEVAGFLADASALASRAAVFNDIRRSALGYALFAISLFPLLRGSYAARDGLASIRRSYTLAELRTIVPDGWAVHRLCPFRLLLVLTK